MPGAVEDRRENLIFATQARTFGRELRRQGSNQRALGPRSLPKASWSDRGSVAGHIGRVDREIFGWVLVAVGARVAFWLLSDRVWEDALITLAHVRNAMSGLGLTHHAGEPVTQGFTSVLSVLIPLAGELVHRGAGLTTLRVASLVGASVAVWAAWTIGERLRLSSWSRRVSLAFLALDPLQIFYGMSGMETQVGVAILLWSAMLLCADSLRPRLIGISLGLALLARPDFLIWVACATFGLWSRGGPRQAALALSIAALVIAPWVAFATVYYGSPVPQTIIAKSVVFATPLGSVAATGDELTARITSVVRTFSPFFEDSMVVSAPVPGSIAVALGAAVWSLALVGARRVMRVSPALPLFVGTFAAYRLLELPPVYFDWYAVPHAAMAILLVGSGIEALRASRPTPRRIATIMLAAAFALPVPWSIGIESRIQHDVEDVVRIPVGEYLRGVVTRGQPVALEPAGYLGYYSGATTYDFPGLTSRTALAAVRALPASQRTVAGMIDALKTPWIVVRPSEFSALRSEDPATADRYVLCARFEGRTGSLVDWNGLTKVSIDTTWEVRRLDGCPTG